MSTERFMSRICKSPGRFTFALLLGAVLALLCLAPPAVFARASGRTGPLSLSSSTGVPSSTAVLNKTGVSVVRLVATYGTGSTRLSCTGLGTLVASEAPSGVSKNYTNWVLTDGNLISTSMNECGQRGDELSLSAIDILASAEYAHDTLIHLDTLGCNASVRGPLLCQSSSLNGGIGTIIAPSSATMASALLTFQSTAGEPYLELSSQSASPLNVGLIRSTSKLVYPSNQVDEKESPTDYLAPSLVGSPSSAPGSTNGMSAQSSTNSIEGGTPAVNDQGQIVGMWTTDGKGGYTEVSMTELQQFLNTNKVPLTPPSATSPQNCTVAGCWNTGIDAFNAANYAAAHANLSRAFQLNARFLGAQAFDTRATDNLHSDNGSDGNTTPPATLHTSGLLDQYPWMPYVAGAILLLLLVLILVLALRARKKRRELKKFNAEVEESRRIAAEQIAQQRVSQQAAPPPPPPAQAPCPNCHAMVNLTDSVCPKCRFPLSPTASGLGIRLMGNAPVASAPVPSAPMPAQQSSPYADQPTMQILPGSPLPTTVDLNEPTLPRVQYQHAKDAASFVQQVRGHNLSLAVGTRTDPGIKRKHKPNEDSLFAARWGDAQFGLFVVADGMGGHANGQDASRLAIQTMIDFMLPQVANGETRTDEEFLKLMEDGVQTSNRAVHNRNMESHADMGTTMTAALVVGSTAYVANVGDSRTYLYREGEGLSKVTHDHSVVASLVDAGIIKPDDIYTHPKRNQIYRSLGEKPVVEVDTFPVQLRPGDKLLLCSDGLWDMVRDPLIQDVLGKTVKNPDETGQNLIKAALNGGGEDNVSVIVVQLAENSEHPGISGVQLLAKPETVTVPNVTPR